MSDADDSGFDKEAERERLREKYEDEKEDRAAAEQMSDLLLKGATMTNAHCGQCGSPIFRVDGQEFCPNCNAEANEAADADSTPSEQSRAPSESEHPADEQLADEVSGGGDAGDPESVSTGGTSIAERAAASVQSGDDAPQPDTERSTGAPEQETPTEPPASGNATLADAQQSLLNAITQHARAATDADPRTARDHLEAASEAAEALAELSQ